MDLFVASLLVACALALGGRDSMVIAGLRDRLGRAPLLLITGCGCAGVSAAVMAWLGMITAPLLPAGAARGVIALVIGLAALDLARPVRVRQPAEPTRSLGAMALVLLARQFGDAARLGVLALALLAPGSAAALGFGGGLGGAIALLLAWSRGGQGLARYPLTAWRRVIALLLALCAVFIGLEARLGVF